MHRLPFAGITVLALLGVTALSGCLGDTVEPAPLTVLAEVYNADGDPRPEVILDFYFTGQGTKGARVDADGDLNLARAQGDARTSKLEFEPIGAVRVEIRKDSRNWIDTREHGSIYREVMGDHHFDEGSSYLIGIDLRGADGHYSSKAQIYYATAGAGAA